MSVLKINLKYRKIKILLEPSVNVDKYLYLFFDFFCNL